MCDPVPSAPASNYSCVQCGSQVEYEGNLLCDRCKRNINSALGETVQRAQDFRGRVTLRTPAALTPTGAAPSTSAVDPGLRNERWSLELQRSGPRKLQKPVSTLDPKDLTIEVNYTGLDVSVTLIHKPTGLSCSNFGRADQKEALHSRLYGELKQRVENAQQVLAERLAAAMIPPLKLPDFPVTVSEEAKNAAMIEAALASSMIPVRIHAHLAPATRDLVARFAEAMADKLYAAQQKYGYWDGWSDPDFIHECRTHLREHLEKGDPRDVANYCAFLWWHNASTVPAELLSAEARTVPEPQPPVREELARLCRNLMLSKMTHNFTFSRDELIMLLGGTERVASLAVQAPRTAPEQPSSQVHPDSALPSRRSDE